MWNNFFRFNYSRGLHDHLKGYGLHCEGITRQSTYQTVFFILIAVSAIGLINFYYGLFNKAYPLFTSKISSRLAWVLNVLFMMVIIFCISYFIAAAALPENRHCSELHFNSMDCFLFALTAAMYTFLSCILISTLIKWRSLNNKKIPF